MHICVAGLCILLRRFKCVCIHVAKKWLFGPSTFQNLLLNVLYMYYSLTEFKRLHCGLLHLASCTDTAIHAFPIRHGGPLVPKYLPCAHIRSRVKHLVLSAYVYLYVYNYVYVCPKNVCFVTLPVINHHKSLYSACSYRVCVL